MVLGLSIREGKREEIHKDEIENLKVAAVENGFVQNDAPAFEDVLETIGSRGKFQWRHNIVFNCLGPCLNLMNVYLYYIAMQTPDHWCHVPGRQLSNMTLQEWKNMTIPRVGDSGLFSKCTMYNMSDSGSGEIPCQYGWDYDDTWYSLTVPSQMNWVCGEKYRVSGVMFYAQNISVVLGFIFGYIGDMYGRRLQYFLCVMALAVGRMTLVFTPSIYVLFIIAESLAAAAGGPHLESGIAVGLELTDMAHRSAVNMYACASFGVGAILAGLVARVFGIWTHYFTFAALSWIILIFFCRWFPESPRWLACRGREEEALSVLRKIAATNGTQVPTTAPQVLRRSAAAKTDRKGLLSIFSSWNLFKNTLILIIQRSATLLTTGSVSLGVGALTVNPLATVSAQGAAQLPACYAAHLCATRFGRRWSAVAAPLLTAAVGVVLVLFLEAGVEGFTLTLMTMLMQFFTTGSRVLCNLQSIEVHPTCLRQITASVEWTVAGVLMSLVPYIVFLGSSVDRKLPFIILSAINLVSAFAVSFLPESANQALPETLEDAAVFGKGRKYWSMKITK